MDTPLLPPPHRAAWLLPVTVCIVVLLIIIGGVYWWLKSSNPAATNTNTKQSVPVTRTGWKTYTSEKYHFRFFYPPNWTVKTVSDEQLELRRNGTQYSIEGAETFAIGVFVEKNTTQKSLTAIAAERQRTIETSTPGAKVNVKQLQVNGQPAIQTADYLGLSVMVLAGENLVTITTPEFGNESTDAPIRDVFELLIPTFSYTQ